MRGDDCRAAVTLRLTGWTDRLVALAATRAELIVEFNELVTATRAAQLEGDPGNATLSRLQAIDRELKELDSSATRIIAGCASLITESNGD